MTHTGKGESKSYLNSRQRDSNPALTILLEPRSMTPHRRPLMEKFKPSLPENLLPKDPHPNYFPVSMSPPAISRACRRSSKNCSVPDRTCLLKERVASRDSQNSHDVAERSDAAESSDTGSPKSGAKCPHCSRLLAYAYNLSKHIEVRCSLQQPDAYLLAA